ncbi:MAG: MBL fold metallo-hydrolase [Candidatus Thorarchaeota archaeon]|nr:MBL fold metallo-hydrolase [Candidatus Thorarchaeota archaeon]
MFENIVGPVYFNESYSFDSNVVYIDCGDHQVLVDTGTGLYPDMLDRALRDVGASLEGITDVVFTHSHIDHIGGVVHLLKNSGLRTYLHKSEADRINAGDMHLTLADTFGGTLPKFKISQPLEQDQVLSFGDIRLKVHHTPGHSIGSICLHEESLRLLITGDTMFPGGSFGRVDFPTGDPKQLVESLRRVAQIDFDIALAGHMGSIRHGGTRAALRSYEMAKAMFS